MPVSSLDLFRQNLFVPKPTFTETNAPDQTNRVHIVTGGYGGCGFELVRILYGRNATVYIAGRDEAKAKTAIKTIQDAEPSSKGRLEFLRLDLSDLTSIKPAAEEFMRKEEKLHVLTNNAGVNSTPPENKTSQSFDVQLSTNCLGPFVLTQCLRPVLRKTAASEPKGTVRVTWAGSFAVELVGPEGIPMASDGAPQIGSDKDANYFMTKVGNLFYGKEFARRYGGEGIVSVVFNPGNLNTDIMRNFPAMKRRLMGLMFYPSKYGAYTELFAALSPDIGIENNGAYIYPWGRVGGLNKLDAAVKPKDDTVNGSGRAQLFWEWTENTTKAWI